MSLLAGVDQSSRIEDPKSTEKETASEKVTLAHERSNLYFAQPSLSYTCFSDRNGFFLLLRNFTLVSKQHGTT